MSIIYVDEIAPFSDGETRVAIPVGEDGVDTDAIEDAAVTLAKLAPEVLAELGGIGYVSNIAAMRNIALPVVLPLINVLGYTTENDGGGGLFYFDSGSSESEDYGTVFVPTGAPATGRWKRLISGQSILVEWFGVKGDEDGLGGGTDNTTAFERIEAYIEAASEALEVHFGAGKFYKTQYIRWGFTSGALVAELTIRGHGATIWSMTNSGSSWNSGNRGHALGVRSMARVKVYELNVDHITAPTLASSTPKDIYSTAMLIMGEDASSAPVDVHIQNCRVRNSWSYGIVVAFGAHSKVLNTLAHNCLAQGIYVENYADSKGRASVVGCEVQACQDWGIDLYGESLEALDNTVYNCIGGIHAKPDSLFGLAPVATVSRNEVQRTYNQGIYLEGAVADTTDNQSQSKVTHNVVRNAGQKYGGGERNATVGTLGHGIHIYTAGKFYGMSIDQNHIGNPAKAGIYATLNNTAAILSLGFLQAIGNNIFETGEEGIFIGTTGTVVRTRAWAFLVGMNKLASIGYDGISLRNAGEGTIRDNELQGVSANGLGTYYAFKLNETGYVRLLGNVHTSNGGDAGFISTTDIDGLVQLNNLEATFGDTPEWTAGPEEDLINPGGFISSLAWGKTALAQGVTDAPLPFGGSVTLTKWVAPRAGSLLKFYAKLDAVITAETAVLRVQKNGSNWTGVTVTLDSGNQSASVSFDKDDETFAVGDEITVLVTTGASFAPNGTAAILTNLVVEM